MQVQQFMITLVVATIALVSAQNYPPRLSIPGAIPVSQSRQQFRSNEKVVRVRRPVAQRSQNTLVPAITPRILEEPKPVTEAPEDEVPDVFLPQLLREQQLAQAQQAQFHQTAAAFFGNEPNSIHDTLPTSHLLQQHEEEIPVVAARFPERGIQQQQQAPAPSSRPAFNDYGIGSNIGGTQRYGLERPQSSPPQPQIQHHQQQQPQQQQRVNVIRSRPAVREQRPQYETAAPPQPAASRPRPKPIQSRPIIDQNQLQDERESAAAINRRQKPVSQTLRKWREENEDGSITWGYENDDGSFKEEIIGTDCVTKGTYGYIDPDGNKREYHYETGIKCDPNTRLTEEDRDQNGFINYEENKAVLPNGIEIDMSQLGKKKSRRPGSNYAN